MNHACGNRTRHTQRIGCCAGCRRLFGSDSAFEAHRKGGSCRDPEAVLTKAGTPRLQPKPSRSAPGETVWVTVTQSSRWHDGSTTT